MQKIQHPHLSLRAVALGSCCSSSLMLLRRSLLCACVALAACSSYSAQRSLPHYDDFHYPAEEPAELKATVVPQLVRVNAENATLHVPGMPDATVSVKNYGEVLVFGEWIVLGVTAGTTVALERNFARWGLLAFVAKKTPPVIMRKSVGLLASIKQPFFNFTGKNPQYFDQITSSLDDYPYELAQRQADEPGFEALASTLAPQRDYASISNNEDVVKFVVTYNGRVKCAVNNNTHTSPQASPVQTGGITELEDLHAKLPNDQTVIFDPAQHLQFWPTRFDNTKMGLIGGHTLIANVGAFTAGKGGFELVAFAPVSRAQSTTSSTSTAAGIDPHFPRQPGINYNPTVLMRLREQTQTSNGSFHYLRISNSTLVTSANSAKTIEASEFYGELLAYRTKYAHVLHERTMQVQLPAGSRSKAGTDAHGQHQDAISLCLFESVLLPGDRRQVDMARAGLLSTLGNFVGAQSNYGNGATYWSVAREDNGSLPLNILTVDDAMLDWGMCAEPLGHITYYLDNYLFANGTINYYTWGFLPDLPQDRNGDSISDYGRLIELYLKASRLCDPAAGSADGWSSRSLPAVARFAEILLEMRQKASSRPVAPTSNGTEGMIIGPPEHDFSYITDRAYYNNNVWALRGMQVMSSHLLSLPPAVGSHKYLQLGRALAAEATNFKADIQKSVQLCSVHRAQTNANATELVFLPPYAELNATPYTNMTAGAAASYANFRFYSETLLSETMPRDVERMMLHFHNSRGGRLGGANRFLDRLDDMPTAGWGFGALSNNETQNFLALLYGHMATYQSRGTFHSTEQLSYKGEGRYRFFNNWPNEGSDSNSSSTSELTLHHGQLHRPDGLSRLGYYVNENDVSFCIVTQILVARLTRWQLILEDFYREASSDAIWLCRGAPKRWFAFDAEAATRIDVRNAPTRVGLVSFSVRVPRDRTAVYSVAIEPPTAIASERVAWKLRWPGTISTAACVNGCSVVEVDATAGIVVVHRSAGAGLLNETAPQFSFNVEASYV